MQAALNSLHRNMQRSGVDSKVLEILEKLRDYDTNTESYNLANGNVVRTPDGT